MTEPEHIYQYERMNVTINQEEKMAHCRMKIQHRLNPSAQNQTDINA